jgi:hypothetical protein
LFYREGSNPATRLDKRRDAVYADAVGHATAWLPVQRSDTIALSVCKARLALAAVSPPGQHLFDILPVGRDFPNATVVLEHKYGGQPDAAARPLEEFVNSPVSATHGAVPVGFVRLRLTCIDNTTDSDGVYLGLTVDQARG